MPESFPGERFLLLHLWLPVAAFVLIALVFEAGSFDLRVADFIYRLSGSEWRLRDAWLTRDLVHEGGRLLSAAVLLAVLAGFFGTFFSRRLRSRRRGLAYLLCSALLTGVLINLLKHWTHVDCPWDLLRYGGDFPYVRTFAGHPDTFRYGACFPAGHASAGWAWLGLYYFSREYHCGGRGVLAAVLITGFVFGVAQQLRGAHFMSHDLWTLGLAWCCATLLYTVFFHRRQNAAEPFIAAAGESQH